MSVQSGEWRTPWATLTWQLHASTALLVQQAANKLLYVYYMLLV